ncbi:hypothetical protein ADEAN_000569800 [Angomonas deanei]|uniref:Uncharacterized protein n=1 Tax=Angomonas deanei TaxID=59799 RepID=A0A7G2CGW4_9TRYP|nr:hypothetical protein ADEAN_000569800 [Angomonas deanei]
MNMDEYPEEADEHSPREALSDDENDQPKKRKKHGKKKRHSHTTEVEDEIEIFPDVPHDGNIIPYLHDEEEENKKEADAVGVVETVAARELASRESCESVELPTTVAAERVLTSSYDDSHQKPAGSGGRKHHKSSVNNSIREDAVLMADYGNQYHDVDRPPQQDASLMASYGDKYASNDNNEKSSPKTKRRNVKV